MSRSQARLKKEFKEVAIFDGGKACNQDVGGQWAPYRREVFSILLEQGWQFLCSTPPDRSATMCEHWAPEILTFQREAQANESERL